MVVPTGVAIRFYFSVNAQLVINTLDAIAQGSVVVNQTLANTIGAAVKSAWQTNLAPLAHTSTSLIRVGLRDLRADNTPEFRDTGAVVSGVVSASDPLPSQLCLCVTKRTQGAGKSFRGRFYAAGFTESANGSTGSASQATADAVLAFLNACGTQYQNSLLSPAVITMPQEEIIISKVTNHTGGTTETKILSHQTAKAGSAHQITTYQNRDLRWETQRRRNDARGTPPSLLFSAGEVPASG